MSAAKLGVAKPRLALFLVADALAVSAMIALAASNSRLLYGDGGYEQPSAVWFILSVALILGELTIVAAVLRGDRPVGKALMGIGALFLAATLVMAAAYRTCVPHYNFGTLFGWHLLMGLLLMGTGTVAWLARRGSR